MFFRARTSGDTQSAPDSLPTAKARVERSRAAYAAAKIAFERARELGLLAAHDVRHAVGGLVHEARHQPHRRAFPRVGLGEARRQQVETALERGQGCPQVVGQGPGEADQLLLSGGDTGSAFAHRL